MNAIKNILIVIAGLAIALFIFAKEQNEKTRKQKAADYAAERAWKDPIVRNCENAVRSMADPGTLTFADPGTPTLGGMLGTGLEYINQTDSGYLYYFRASDASTGNTPISILCYTNRQGQVVRIVPKAQM